MIVDVKGNPIKAAKALYENSTAFESLSSSHASSSERANALSKLYEDALIQQAVEDPVRDSLSLWREFDDRALEARDKELGIHNSMLMAGIHARVQGQAMLIPAIINRRTGGRVPLNTTMAKLAETPSEYEVVRISLIKFFEPADVIINDITSDDHGSPEYYTAGNRIHASRCCIINANNAGTSFIESILSYFCDFKDRNVETTRAVKEANFLAFGTDLKMLLEIATSKADAMGGNPQHIVGQLIKERLSDLRMNANNTGAWGYDKESETVSQVAKTNIKALVSATTQSAQFLSAAVNQPHSRFLGAGNSTLSGDGGDGANQRQMLVGLRSFMFDAALDRIYKTIALFDPDVKGVGSKWVDGLVS